MSSAPLNKVAPADYVASQPNSCRCVDERMDKEGENLGVQMPGGSEHLMDLLWVAITKSGKNVPEEELFDMVDTVYASDVAKGHSLKPGVHIDDEHGHLDMDACATRDAGCGYDKVRTQVLQALYDTSPEYDPGKRIQAARDRNWGVQVLTGDHVPHATAALNHMTGKTLATNSLWEEGRNPSFNHDIWVVEALLPSMVQVLKDNGYDEAASLLEENAHTWSEDIYGQTLDVLSNGALTKASLIHMS